MQGHHRLTRLPLVLPIGLCAALSTPAQAQAVDSNLYLIALAGQSNMTGARLKLVSQLPAGFPVNASRIWNFTNADTWELAKEPIDSSLNQVDAVSLDNNPGVGPSLAMADAFATKNPRVRVGLVPCAKSGSSIDAWQPNSSRDSLYGSLPLPAKAGLKAG
jgi:hypothetical protein